MNSLGNRSQVSPVRQRGRFFGVLVVLILPLTVCRSPLSPTSSGEEGAGAQTLPQLALDTYKQEQAGRPEVEMRGREAMVVCSHPLAAQAGARILMAGGNAVDAAVAVGDQDENCCEGHASKYRNRDTPCEKRVALRTGSPLLRMRARAPNNTAPPAGQVFAKQ